MKRLSLLTLLLVYPLAWGDVTLPTEVKGIAGEWIVIAPTKIDGGEPKWRMGPGLTQVDLKALFPDLKAKGIVVKGKKGLVSYVESWNAKGDVASDIAVCKVVIEGDPDTPPDPIVPTDELTKALSEAYSQETSTEKAVQVKLLASVYKAAAILASSKSVMTARQLLTAIQGESKKLLKDTDLLKIRKDTLQPYLNKQLPTDPLKILTDADKATMVTVYGKIGSILEGLK